MTYGKLKQFRRDRLYTSDKERLGGLVDLLKKHRITDDQQNCQTCLNNGMFNYILSPNKNNKNWDKNNSPNKTSPNKQTQNKQGFSDASHTNNGQVMTQISAIYSKRSRSILNQFGQSNIVNNAPTTSNLYSGNSNQNRQ